MENICETKYEKRKLKAKYKIKKNEEISSSELKSIENFDPVFMVDLEQSQNMFTVHETDRMVM